MGTLAIIESRVPLIFPSQRVAKITTFNYNLNILFFRGLLNILNIQLNIELLLYLTKAWRKSSFLSGKLGWCNCTLMKFMFGRLIDISIEIYLNQTQKTSLNVYLLFNLHTGTAGKTAFAEKSVRACSEHYQAWFSLTFDCSRNLLDNDMSQNSTVRCCCCFFQYSHYIPVP